MSEHRHSAEVRLSVDRGAAVVRASWRLLGASAAGVVMWIVRGGQRWSILWAHETASALAWLVLLAVVGLPAILLILAALRWLLLALWPAESHISLSPTHIRFRLGPFGRRDYSTHELSITLESLTDDAEVEDSAGPCGLVSILDRRTRSNIGATIQRFAGIDAETLSRLAAPVLVPDDDAAEP